jgi:cbb3-type cytochrome oxidase maturation protein
MTVLIYLIPIAIGLGLLGLAAFMWSLKSGQFDDLEGAAHRVLFDEDEDERRLRDEEERRRTADRDDERGS